MSFNFPNAPNVGDLYPTVPAAGQPQYHWDGQKWQTGSPDASGAVRYDQTQTLTDPQRAQARSNIYAAPFDALAYNGMQVNGNMDISQESGATARTTNGAYLVDGWQLFTGGAQAISVAQVADAPPGYKYSIKLTVTTANAAPGAADQCQFVHRIEGVRVSRLAFGTANAQPVSIGFWSKIHRTGTYSGVVINGANNRSYVFTFTQTVSDAWQYNTLTIPGDTAGTWANDNSSGLELHLCVMTGSTYQGAANAWTAANLVGATGTTNGVAATTDVYQFTGLVILPGIQLPSASRAPLIMRPADQELLVCQRYLWRWSPGQYWRLAIAYCDQATSAQVVLYLPTPMRATPAVTYANLTLNGTTIASISSPAVSDNVVWMIFNSSGLPTSSAVQVYSSTATGAFLQLDARL